MQVVSSVNKVDEDVKIRYRQHIGTGHRELEYKSGQGYLREKNYTSAQHSASCHDLFNLNVLVLAEGFAYGDLSQSKKYRPFPPRI